MHAATAFLIALILASAASAEEEAAQSERLNGAAFNALTEGRTAHFSVDGEYYGSEQYLEGNQSIWRDREGDCHDGIWWTSGPTICFRYETISCWEIYGSQSEGYYAVSELNLRVDFEGFQDAPLNCSVPLV